MLQVGYRGKVLVRAASENENYQETKCTLDLTI